MATVFNFSHPLSPTAVEKLEEMTGDDLAFAEISLQRIDQSQPIKPQIRAAIRESAGNGVAPDYIIPPAYVPAAVVLARIYPAAKFVRLDALGTPPQWLPAEIF